MRTLLFATALVAMAPAAQADPDHTIDVKQMHSDDCARARKEKKTCVLDMGSETLEGDKPGGDGVRVDILKFMKAQSLIHIRRDFIVEILKTAEDL